MVRRALCAVLVAIVMPVVGCATRDAPDPRGKWRPVNQFSQVPHAIPLQQNYVYQAFPVDGTLKAMLGRWAKDSKLTLSYLHPNDYTLYAPVGNIRTRSLEDAAAALSSAYAGQRVVVAVERPLIIVRMASDAVGGDAAAGVHAASGSSE